MPTGINIAMMSVLDSVELVVGTALATLEPAGELVDVGTDVAITTGTVGGVKFGPDVAMICAWAHVWRKDVSRRKVRNARINGGFGGSSHMIAKVEEWVGDGRRYLKLATLNKSLLLEHHGP
jgi:hypothetical protein